MIDGRDFVVFSDEWSGLPTSSIHLFQRIAPRNRVFWFNMFNRMPSLQWNDVQKVTRLMGGWATRSLRPRGADNTRSMGDNPCVTNCFIIPVFKPAIRQANRWLLERTYRRVFSEHGVRNPIVVATWPSAVDLVREIDAELKLYYCVDEWLDYPGFNRRDWERMEDDLILCVDGLVATSRELVRKGKGGLPTLYLPHGVDFDHFNQGGGRCEAVLELERLRKPVVGFFGLISEWIALDVIADLADTFPNVSFVMLGKSEVSMTDVCRHPNVRWLGLVPYADLPRYARYFDVGLIPFVNSALTKAVNPLKLLEYYALGLPVLATRLPELASADGPIHLAESHEEFRRGLAEILSHPRPSQQALSAARSNTWQERVEQLYGFIQQVRGEGTRASSTADCARQPRPLI